VYEDIGNGETDFVWYPLLHGVRSYREVDQANRCKGPMRCLPYSWYLVGILVIAPKSIVPRSLLASF
jgi:hypothetical protein